jgi:hypothetical protein
MNTKISIGVVVAFVLQISGFVWWTAQQAQTIDTLKIEMSELTSRMAIESSVRMAKDIDDLKNEREKIIDNIRRLKKTQRDLVDFATFTENRWAKAYADDNSYVRKFGTKEPKETK